jgi:uncharacterized membrane protein
MIPKIKLTNFFTKVEQSFIAPVSDQVKQQEERHKMFESIEANINANRTLGERFADNLVMWFGSIWFVAANMAVFLFWILINIGTFPEIEIFDPYPFTLLTMAVSLEAIFLSIFVLMSQNRESMISDLREEIDLQINMIAEQEITKIIHLLSAVMKHLDVPYERDPELKKMMKPLNTEEIRKELEGQLRKHF